MTSRLFSSLPFIGFVLFVVGVPFWLSQPSLTPSVRQEGGPGRAPDYFMENFSAIQMASDGVSRQMLFAEKVIHYPDDDSAELKKPYFIETPVDKPTVQVKSDEAKITGHKNDIYLTGSVTLIRNANKGRSETTLATSLLHLLPKDDIAKTDKPIVITEANAVIKAVGMEMNNRTGITNLVSQVKVFHEKSR